MTSCCRELCWLWRRRKKKRAQLEGRFYDGQIWNETIDCVMWKMMMMAMVSFSF